MTIQTFEKVQTHIQGIQYTGGRESAMEICRWVGNDSAYIPPTKDEPREFVQIPTMFGPRDIMLTDWVVKIAEGTFLTYKDEAINAEYSLVKDPEDQRLIQHARTELSKFPNEDPDFVESIINTIKSFASYRGHSGSSAAIAIHMVTALLKGENLLPLTDDPDEWELHEGLNYGLNYDMWQNKRNSKAISNDGGKTYFLTDEPRVEGELQIHTSELKDFKPEIDPDDLLTMDEKYQETSCSVPGHRDGRVNEEEGYFYCPDCEADFPLVLKVKVEDANLS